MIEQTLQLARVGFAIHWLHPMSKRPIGNDWSTIPVASIDELKRTWNEKNNTGVRLGQWSKVSGQYLHVFDLDIRDQELTEEAHARLSEILPDWQTFPTVKSGSGGASRHIYVLLERPFASKKLAHSVGFTMVWDEEKKREVKKWDWEIELFGTGKQVAMPPSIHPDTKKPYVWVRAFDLEMLEMGIAPTTNTENIAKLIRAPVETEEVDPERNKPIGLTLEEAEQILKDLPEDQYREDRDGWLNVGMALHHEFAGSDEAFKLWCDYSKASEKFDKKDQKVVWKSFKPKPKMLRMATLMSAAKEARIMAMFDDDDDLEDDLLGDTPAPDIIEETDLLGDPVVKSAPVSKRQQKLNKAEVEHDLKHIPPKVRRLNKKHAVARVKGKTIILDFHANGEVSYGSPNDLHAYYENDRVATDKSTEPVSKQWMRHKDRRDYPNGIVFSPNREIKGAYNHWQGFSVEADPDGDCRRFLKHVRHIVCRDNEENYRYLIGWLAHMIQRPEEKPGVAVVLRGKKGTGKDTVGDYVGGLFPHHHVKIANQEQLTGKFNQHQEKCLLLHVEEGFWAGSKQAEGPLKHLITSEDVLIEPKGINPFKVASVLRLLITSNEKWVVPASADERRYFVLDISSDRMQDTPYFDKIRHEMKNGGRAALLDYLQNYDLSGFNVRAVPATSALTDQKLEGLHNLEAWWFGMLESGELDLGAKHGFDEDDNTNKWFLQGIRVDKFELREAYTRWMRSRRYEGDILRDSEIGKRMKLMIPGIKESQRRVETKVHRIYHLPDLDTCRENFEQYLRAEITWPANDVPEEAPPPEPEFLESDDDLLS